MIKANKFPFDFFYIAYQYLNFDRDDHLENEYLLIKRARRKFVSSLNKTLNIPFGVGELWLLFTFPYNASKAAGMSVVNFL